MTRVRGSQLKNQTVKKDQIGNKEITNQQIADLTITNLQISSSAGIEQSKIDGLTAALASKVDIGGSTLTGPILLPGDPTDPLHAATKQYVDNATAGSKFLLKKNFNLLDLNLNALHCPVSTSIAATVTTSVYDEVSNFITIGNSNYSVYTNTIIADFGTERFLYQLGGSQGTLATEIRNVSRTSLDNNGQQSTWSSIGAPDLPEPATDTGKGAILTSSSGKHILFAKGKGDNLLWRSDPINSSTGHYTGWNILNPLPLNGGDPEIVVIDFSGTQYAYILLNNAGGSSDLVIAQFDSNGDVVNYTTNTIPQTIIGKLVSLSNTHLYILGTGAASDQLYIGEINSTTKDVTWTSQTTNLPINLTDFSVSLHETSNGDNRIFVFGGDLNGSLQDTIYFSDIDLAGIPGSFNTAPATLEEPTAGAGTSIINIQNKEFIYITGGRRATGFVDNSTIKTALNEITYNEVQRDFDAGSFYHVNGDESNRPLQSFVFSPNPSEDPTLSLPINVFYFARKDSSNTDYIATTSIDPNIPEDLSDNEHLLVRIDQINPATGVVKTQEINTTPIFAQDYLEVQELTSQIFDIDSAKIVIGVNQVTFNEGAFKLGNIKRVFTSPFYSISGLGTDQELWVYWSSYDIITSSEEIENKILLGKIIVNSGSITFQGATQGLIFLTENLTVAASDNISIMHGFNTDNFSVNVWTKDGSDIVLNQNIKILKLGLNTLQISNLLNIDLEIEKILIKKEK